MKSVGTYKIYDVSIDEIMRRLDLKPSKTKHRILDNSKGIRFTVDVTNDDG